MRRLTVLYLPPLLAFPNVRIIYIDEFCFVKNIDIVCTSLGFIAGSNTNGRGSAVNRTLDGSTYPS
jgi:hypothetical protein